MKTKFEYEVVTKKNNEVMAWCGSREEARNAKRDIEFYAEIPVRIIQKKYELVSEKTVR